MNYLGNLKKVLVSIGIMAALLIVPVSQSAFANGGFNSTRLINITKSLQGIKYKWGGTTTSGFDCSGYVRYVFNSLGINTLPRTASAMYGTGTSVSKANLQVGDLVFFNTSGKSGSVSHVGIYVGDGKFSHAANSGVGVSSVNDPYYWGKRYVGAKRVVNGVSSASVNLNGWVKQSNQWFYYQNNQVKTGWFQNAGKWYYSNNSGVMQTGWVQSGSKWYYMNSSGAMVTGWSQVGSKWYYHNQSGEMQTGWIQLGNTWYYLYGSGEMAQNTTIGNHTFGSDGAWIE